MKQVDLEEAVFSSFKGELDALKPGNVSRYADGHGMIYSDFIRSAEAVTPIICDPQLTAGERILQAVRSTRDVVGCNTNLGMLLLFVPIIKAWQLSPAEQGLQQAIRQVLVEIDEVDTRNVFAAINLAQPGGLGKFDEYDVSSPADCSILQAMEAAKERDFIALQYSNSFCQLFDPGVVLFKNYMKRWNHLEWATVGCYLSYMSTYPDAHIRRKLGDDVASRIKAQCRQLSLRFNDNNNPEDSEQFLLEFDRDLKHDNINPGTTADLTAATLLLFKLVES